MIRRYDRPIIQLAGQGVSKTFDAGSELERGTLWGFKSQSGDITILDLRGRSTIDGGESEVLSKHLQKLVANGVRKVLLNLIELTQVDSSGISIIVRTYVSLKRQGGDLGLLRPAGRVLEVFRVLRLLDTIPTFEDEAQALASFQPRDYSATS